MASSPVKDDKSVLPQQVDTTHSRNGDSDEIVSLQKGDLLDLESVDPVLNAKMRLVNDAIDEIGFTMYQAKLFVLNGFGYVDASSSCLGKTGYTVVKERGFVARCGTALSVRQLSTPSNTYDRRADTCTPHDT